jgi:hypothetical protein
MSLPTYDLELKASEERKRLQTHVHDLKLRLHQSLDLSRTARQHLSSTCGAVGLVTVAAGYVLAALLDRRP